MALAVVGGGRAPAVARSARSARGRAGRPAGACAVGARPVGGPARVSARSSAPGRRPVEAWSRALGTAAAGPVPTVDALLAATSRPARRAVPRPPTRAGRGLGLRADGVAAVPRTRATDGAVQRVRAVLAAARLSDELGAPLAGVLERIASAVAADEEADGERRAALAGPRSTAQVLAWLPLLGVALGALLGADPVGGGALRRPRDGVGGARRGDAPAGPLVDGRAPRAGRPSRRRAPGALEQRRPSSVPVLRAAPVVTPAVLAVLVALSCGAATSPWWWARGPPRRAGAGLGRPVRARARADGRGAPARPARRRDRHGASLPRALSAVGAAVGGQQGDELARGGAALLLGASWQSAWAGDRADGRRRRARGQLEHRDRARTGAARASGPAAAGPPHPLPHRGRARSGCSSSCRSGCASCRRSSCSASCRCSSAWRATCSGDGRGRSGATATRPRRPPGRRSALGAPSSRPQRPAAVELPSEAPRPADRRPATEPPGASRGRAVDAGGTPDLHGAT